jgi:clan AA aspartic protease
MGQLRVAITLRSRVTDSSWTGEALVDTGSAYSVVPRPIAEMLGVETMRIQRVIFASGVAEQWPLGAVAIEYEGQHCPTAAFIGPPGGEVLLGAIALETLGLAVDPVNLRLVPMEPIRARPI